MAGVNGATCEAELRVEEKPAPLQARQLMASRSSTPELLPSLAAACRYQEV